MAKTIIDGKKRYRCLWNDCTFCTWNYSQHISRHIYLKHIGIKKLQCNIDGCGKLFKRPESLVQHMKNHNCGFGIDNDTMKNPDNICGVRNIRRYFSRTLDNDIYVYQCRFGDCKFHTHNSGSIRRHVHNQHVCPFSASNNNSNNNNNNIVQQQQEYGEANPIIIDNHSYDDSNDQSSSPLSSTPPPPDVEVQLNEFDNQLYDPERRQIPPNGLYSLKNFKGQFRKERNESNGVEFICNRCGFRAPSQITLVRHLWSENGYKNFTCDNCDQIFDSEVALYKHRKTIHQQTTSTSSLSPPHLPVVMVPSSHPTLSNNNITNNSVCSSYSSSQTIVQHIPSLNNDNSMNIPQQRQQQFTNDNQLSAINDMNNGATLMALLMMQSQLPDPLIKNSDGSNEFRCRICPTYVVRSRQSITKHMKNYHPLHQQQQQQQQNHLQMLKMVLQTQTQTQTSSTSSSPQQQQTDEEESVNNNLEIDSNPDDSTVTAGQQVEQQQQQRQSSGRDKNGLYSLKKFPDYYRRQRMPDGSPGYQYVCLKCMDEQSYATKSQASMIRHIWQHKPQNFHCPICMFPCENEFALYKHKKHKHPESTSDDDAHTQQLQQQQQPEKTSRRSLQFKTYKYNCQSSSSLQIDDDYNDDDDE
ncbi:hypothetical protein HUG17_3511 [Dermatophagoides farinae]|uniref:C2H2-type domain-containing protein n=1 Tax=Dermatophagoides farinae TaxID=6954 RepID=A0A9D4NW77_DERFA|nr:hypothetical protein HUG17_3511 [Dermatophagoides farinae]